MFTCSKAFEEVGLVEVVVDGITTSARRMDIEPYSVEPAKVNSCCHSDTPYHSRKTLSDMRSFVREYADGLIPLVVGAHT